MPRPAVRPLLSTFHVLPPSNRQPNDMSSHHTYYPPPHQACYLWGHPSFHLPFLPHPIRRLSNPSPSATYSSSNRPRTCSKSSTVSMTTSPTIQSLHLPSSRLHYMPLVASKTTRLLSGSSRTSSPGRHPGARPPATPPSALFVRGRCFFLCGFEAALNSNTDTGDPSSYRIAQTNVKRLVELSDSHALWRCKVTISFSL